jgi:hypothetical protein
MRNISISYTGYTWTGPSASPVAMAIAVLAADVALHAVQRGVLVHLGT